MQTIHPEDILDYIQCPRRALNNAKHKRKINTRLSIFKNVVKKAYNHQLQNRSYMLWRTVSNLLDKEIKRQTKSVKDHEKHTSLLPVVHKWYHTYYVHENTHLVVDLPVIINLDNRIIYHDVLDAVFMDDEIVISDFCEANKLDAVNSLVLYNDHLTQLKAWGLWKAFGQAPDKYQRFYVTKSTIGDVSYFIKGDILERAEKLIQHAGYGVFNGAYYPIRGEQCNTCPHFVTCSF